MQSSVFSQFDLIVRGQLFAQITLQSNNTWEARDYLTNEVNSELHHPSLHAQPHPLEPLIPTPAIVALILQVQIFLVLSWHPA